MVLSLALALLAAATDVASPRETGVAPPRPAWTGKTARDLHREYHNIFRHGNRNAASHLWTSFLLDRSRDMSHENLVHLFEGYCAVSGSPVHPSPYRKYRLTLD